MYIYYINHETNDTYDIKGIRFKGPEINYFYNVFDYIKTRKVRTDSLMGP